MKPDPMQKIVLVAGTRPNFVKVAPLWRAFSQRENVEVVLIHTGQHYDEAMSRVFFDDLGLPEPAFNLNAGGKSHARQTAAIMERFDEVMDQIRPDDVVVVGDVNSTLACSLVAVKRGIRTSHVEAGLRSFDRAMPEEINRLATDAIADLLFVSEPSGLKNLQREGVAEDKIHFVGNVMIDSLVYAQESIRTSRALESLRLKEREYVLMTLHRPSNVDDSVRLQQVMDWIMGLSLRIPVVLPLHPRTLSNLEKSGSDLVKMRSEYPNLKITAPRGYIDFQRLLKGARMVVTDSGGLQEETTWLGIPCVTLRENTERPVTIDQGTNFLAGSSLKEASGMVDRFLNGGMTIKGKPDLWDGQAAERIAKIIVDGG